LIKRLCVAAINAGFAIPAGNAGAAPQNHAPDRRHLGKIQGGLRIEIPSITAKDAADPVQFRGVRCG
jgi:hypothetical protein